MNTTNNQGRNQKILEYLQFASDALLPTTDEVAKHALKAKMDRLREELSLSHEEIVEIARDILEKS